MYHIYFSLFWLFFFWPFLLTFFSCWTIRRRYSNSQTLVLASRLAPRWVAACAPTTTTDAVPKGCAWWPDACCYRFYFVFLDLSFYYLCSDPCIITTENKICTDGFIAIGHYVCDLASGTQTFCVFLSIMNMVRCLSTFIYFQHTIPILIFFSKLASAKVTIRPLSKLIIIKLRLSDLNLNLNKTV